jgi:hypothetical protein
MNPEPPKDMMRFEDYESDLINLRIQFLQKGSIGLDLKGFKNESCKLSLGT